jgi:hypothetical protein
MKALRNGRWFLWLWTILWFAFGADFLDGEFRFGRRNAVTITRTDNPVFFWCWISFWILAGTVVAAVAFKETKDALRADK